MNVQDTGPLNPLIMFVGEAPGAEEEREGVPFIGPAGKMLRHACEHAGIDPSSSYITNVSQTRPPHNDFTIHYNDKQKRQPSSYLISAWSALQQKVHDVHPKVVVPLGGEALRALTGNPHISEWRGCPTRSDLDSVLLPTYHPSAVLHDMSLLPIFELDLKKAARISTTGLHFPTPDFRFPKSPVEVEHLIQLLRESPYVSFDIETIGPHVRMIALSNGRMTVSIPFVRIQGVPLLGKRFVLYGSPMENVWSIEDEVRILNALDGLFMDLAVRKVGQNSICFDQPFLEREFSLGFRNHYIDIMHIFHLLYPELPKSLDFLSTVYTDYPNYWSNMNHASDSMEAKYNCWDALVTAACCDQIMTELEEDSKLCDFYCRQVAPLAMILAKMQKRGVKVNAAKRREILELLSNEEAKLLAELRKETYPAFNPNSPKQLMTFLYVKRKYKVITKKGNPTTDERALRIIANTHPTDPVPLLIIQHREVSKLQDFLVQELDADNRVHTSYNASGTETGRLSSSKPLSGPGMNLQNIPKDPRIRELFIPEEGNVFVKMDLSQAETRVVAEILARLGFPQLHDKYQDPAFDIHRWQASTIFGKVEAIVSSWERSIGKLCNHSGNYQAGPGVMVARAAKDGIPGVTQTFAKNLLESRLNSILGLREWWAWVAETIRTTRTLTTCFGRKRQFFGRLDRDGKVLRDATAYEPQSTVADLTNRILIRVDQFLPKEAFPVLQVHDELILETPLTQLNRTIAALEKAGKVSLEIWPGHPMTIPMDISVGNSWGTCKELHNEKV